MRRWRFRLLPIAVLLSFGLAARAESGARLYLPGGPSVVAWSSSESYEGGAQADPRLDRPVKIWQAGITLADAFASVKEQTGVEIGFWPSDDPNTRVPVNLYLNPSEPPSLRALMVQLAWVVDTSYCVTDEPGEKAYILLSTSIAQSAEYSVALQREESVEARKMAQRAIEAKLDEYRSALALSREEVIRKYQRTDDFMLLNLLDPARRAVVRLVCRHLTTVRPPEGVGEDADTGGWSSRLLDVYRSTPDDTADLQAAFGAIPSSVSVNVFVAPGRPRLHLVAQVRRAEQTNAEWPFVERPIVDLPSHPFMTVDEELDLHRALGEQITPEQAVELAKQRADRLQAAARESKQLPGSALSEAAWQRLTALKVPPQSGPGLVPWQLFEEVAKASGYDVVTDAFANGANLVPLKPAKDGDGDTGVEVWPSLGVLSRRVSARGLQAPEWEWGDAGDFLRFRSSHRDIYRAAVLPQEYLDWVDALAVPYLPEPGNEQRSVRFTLSVNPVEWTRRMARLTDVQIQYGSSIGYGDPHDPKIAIRQALLSSIAHAIPVPAPIVQFCGTLSDEQWARMRNGGLAAPDDIPLEQVEPLVAQMPVSLPAATPGSRQRVVVRLREPADNEESEMPGWSSLFVDVWEGDSRQTGAHQFAAKQIEVHAEWPR